MARILVVDDDAHIRGLLDQGFSREGHAVIAVPELVQAFERLGQEEFDLVILDLDMRGEHGDLFLTKIRAAKSDIPIVIYSGMVDRDVELRLRKAGANEVINKGEGISELLQKTEKILKVGHRLFRAPAKERTLLIVEDDEATRNLLHIFFAKKGFKTWEAEDGEKALAVAKSEKISCALLDVNLPGLSGLEILPGLLVINPNMGIVMISGDGDEAIVKKAISMGAYSYVIKPFDFVYLELAVTSRLAIASGE